MTTNDPFSANIFKHILSPKLVDDAAGGFDVKVDLVNIDNVSTGSLSVVGDITTTGNITANGDGYTTGGIVGQYLGLVDYTPPVPGSPPTYLYSNNNQLIYANNDNTTLPVDVVGWQAKLAQTDTITLLAEDGSASAIDIAKKINEVIKTLYNRGLIYKAPNLPVSTSVSFNVLAATGAVVTLVPGPINNSYANVLSVPSSVWSTDLSNLVNISQISSIVINVYAGINVGSNRISDARCITSNPEITPGIFYAYANRITPLPGDIFAVGITSTITDTATIQGLYSSVGSDLINTTRAINLFWFIGYAGTSLRNCQVLSYTINYSY